MIKGKMKGEYILLTPAKNEAAYIEKTIHAVIDQTLLPKKWVIINDGSTDRTDDIVQEYAALYGWIYYLKVPVHERRDFASKVFAFNRGYEIVRQEKYDIIGNLDADITFDRDYFEFLIKKFDEDPKLGVAGTPFVEGGNHYDYRFTNIEHVSGACQLFRRECFEEIGGYIPIKSGGIDWVAVTTARMKGWKTKTFTEKTCVHHRKIGTGNNKGKLITWLKQGRKDFLLGNHPVWELFRIPYQMAKNPYIIAGLCLALGYVWAGLKREQRPISDDLMQFIRREQMRRLKNFIQKWGANH